MRKAQVIVAAAAFFFAGALQSTRAGRDLVIRLPAGMDHPGLQVVVGVYGRGLSLGPARKVSGTEYVQQLPESTTRAKLLIYSPNYKMVTATLYPVSVPGKPFAPKFEKAKMVPVRVRMVDSKGKPIPGLALTLAVKLYEWEYFSYASGRGDESKIDDVLTDWLGEFTAQVPVLLDDPYFVKHKDLRIQMHLTERTGGEGPFGCDIVTEGLPAQRSYPETLTRTLVYRGRLSGTVDDAFLSRNGINTQAGGNYGPYVMPRRAGDRGGMGSRLKENGSFGIPLSAGTYDLTVEWGEGKDFRSVVALKGVVVGEREDKVVVIR